MLPVVGGRRRYNFYFKKKLVSICFILKFVNSWIAFFLNKDEDKIMKINIIRAWLIEF